MTWWFRAVGTLYVLSGVMAAVVKAPIRAEGPPGVLRAAATGDAVARFVVDTWVTLGLVIGALGIAVLAAHTPALLWVVIAVEVAGMIADVYKLARGTPARAPVTWLAIHAAVIVSGLVCAQS
jgi:hypothetical protein